MDIDGNIIHMQVPVSFFFRRHNVTTNLPSQEEGNSFVKYCNYTSHIQCVVTLVFVTKKGTFERHPAISINQIQSR
jgi:hypothetical protein